MIAIPPWFTVLDWRYCATFYWLFVWIKTDIPTWLIMRYSPRPALKLIEFPLDRGVRHPFYRPKFYEEWFSIQQQEQGRTIEHTFHLELRAWRLGLYILFHAPSFRARNQSQMGVFHVHFPREPYYILLDHEEWEPPGP